MQFGLEKIIAYGGVGVVPTDTIYGIVGSALNKKSVLRIYKLRKRNLRKPMIILIGGFVDLKKLGIKANAKIKKILNKFWPGKVSVILPCTSKKLTYLHRGTKTLAIRMPAKKWLRDLIKKTGPLVAPSANFEGKRPSKTIKDAARYFGNKVDFYVDAGRLVSKPSTLITIQNNKLIVLRQGEVKIKS